jgi:transcriptional regulator with XRE-family HTH domain
MNNDEKLEKEFSAEFRAKVRARVVELRAEEMGLRELREALDRTQTNIAKELGITQDGVSRLEKRSDLLLSTVRNYVKALSGELKLIVEIPDHKPVLLCGISDIADFKSRRPRRQRKQGGKKPAPKKQGTFRASRNSRITG